GGCFSIGSLKDNRGQFVRVIKVRADAMGYVGRRSSGIPRTMAASSLCHHRRLTQSVKKEEKGTGVVTPSGSKIRGFPPCVKEGGI
ncbi:hypothetical protein, partial [Eubacterium aggregans]|uniref:hypothetical protein n=1 Tax=Eubacterium aggregans TaxID=81409 RepID=UPI003F3754A0